MLFSPCMMTGVVGTSKSLGKCINFIILWLIKSFMNLASLVPLGVAITQGLIGQGQLDHALNNSSWLQFFSNTMGSHIDHNAFNAPLLLHLDSGRHRCSKHLSFEIFPREYPLARDVIAHAWSRNARDSAMYKVNHKLLMVV